MEIKDNGGSGLEEPPKFDYYIEPETGYSGEYKDMKPNDGWWVLEISEDWSKHAGQMLHYKVQAIDVAGNQASKEDSVIIKVVGPCIRNLFSYPNPAIGDKSTIRFQAAKRINVEIQIYNILGELVFSDRKEDTTVGWNESVWDVSNVARGVYILKIDAEEMNKLLFKKIAVIRK